jgi:ketosteroid isomerase-like protein
MMAMMTEDIVFETTEPPDGRRFEGQEAVRGAFLDFLRSSTEPRFEVEEMIAAGDRATVPWLYRWTNPDGSEGHVRGVDVMRVRNGKVAESLAYVKG